MTPSLKSKYDEASKPTHLPTSFCQYLAGHPQEMAGPAKNGQLVPVHLPLACRHMPHVTQNPNDDSNEDTGPTSSQALDSLLLVGKNRPRHRIPTHRLYKQHSSLCALAHPSGSRRECSDMHCFGVLQPCFEDADQGEDGSKSLCLAQPCLSQAKLPDPPFCLLTHVRGTAFTS